jgi:hypothetical protein
LSGLGGAGGDQRLAALTGDVPLAYALAAGALLVPALLVLLVPRRRLWAAMLLWVLAPVIAYAAVVLLEAFTRPGTEDPFATALYGFMLISPLLAPVWLLICALGFAIGFGLRLFRRRRPAVTARPGPPPSVAASPSSRPEDEVGLSLGRFGNGPGFSRVSPDGAIRVDLAAVEWSNTHWVHSPRVIETASGRVVLDLWNTDWDASVGFPGPGLVRLDFRRYRVKGNVSAVLDLPRQTYQIVAEDGQSGALPPAPLAEVAAGLEAASRRAAAHAGATGQAGRPANVPHRFAAWRTALLLLLGALVAITGITAVMVHFDRPPPTRLTPLPSMPNLEGSPR